MGYRIGEKGRRGNFVGSNPDSVAIARIPVDVKSSRPVKATSVPLSMTELRLRFRGRRASEYGKQVSRDRADEKAENVTQQGQPIGGSGHHRTDAKRNE